jgi:hypothetical protein
MLLLLELLVVFLVDPAPAQVVGTGSLLLVIPMLLLADRTCTLKTPEIATALKEATTANRPLSLTTETGMLATAV